MAASHPLYAKTGEHLETSGELGSDGFQYTECLGCDLERRTPREAFWIDQDKKVSA